MIKSPTRVSSEACPSFSNTPDQKDKDTSPEGSQKQGFFAIDLRLWKRALLLGINEAVSFVVLARGSGGDNATTSWSTDAVERYTGISRPKAKKALETLEHHGIVELVRGGTKPVRRIKSSWEVPGCTGYRGDLTADETEFLAILPLTDGQICRSKRFKRLADQVRLKGHADWRWEKSRQLLSFNVDDVEHDQVWVWLPNTLVDGASGETAPLELVRQMQCLMALRMLIEVYHHQLFDVWGGANPNYVGHLLFDRHDLGECGQYRIWGFSRIPSCFGYAAGSLADPSWPPTPGEIFNTAPYSEEDSDRWLKVHGDTLVPAWGCRSLGELGLVDWVPCLFESDGPDAEVIYPIGGVGEAGVLSDDELSFGNAAREAALKMIPHRKHQDFSDIILAPVPAHIRNVQMRGIARTRYRPHTSLTSKWCADSARLSAISDGFSRVLN